MVLKMLLLFVLVLLVLLLLLLLLLFLLLLLLLLLHLVLFAGTAQFGPEGNVSVASFQHSHQIGNVSSGKD